MAHGEPKVSTAVKETPLWAVNDSLETSSDRAGEGEASELDGGVRELKFVHDKGDDGTPSGSIAGDVLRSLHLIRDERHLVAYDLYRDARGRIDNLRAKFDYARNEGGESAAARKRSPVRMRRGSFGSRSKATSPEDRKGARSPDDGDARDYGDWKMATVLINKHKNEFDTLQKKALLFHRAKRNLNIDDDWTVAQTLFGITTYYRREADSSLSIKLEGELAGIPLFDQVVVLRETDLYHLWAPFCVQSRTLKQLGNLDVVGWWLTGLPSFGLSRDSCFRAVGCDCMMEDGSVMIVAQGINDTVEHGVKPYLSMQVPSLHRRKAKPTEQSEAAPTRSPPVSRDSLANCLSDDPAVAGISIPPVPTKFGTGRITVRSFQAEIEVVSPNSARTRIVANIDPNVRLLPQPLIDFCMKKLCGVLLSRLQAAARRIERDPVGSPHAQRMREDARFYRDWLLPKFRQYCDLLGWDLPLVKPFEVTDEELEEREWVLLRRKNALERKSRRSHSFDDLDLLTPRSERSVLSDTGDTGGGGRALLSSSAHPEFVGSTLRIPSLREKSRTDLKPVLDLHSFALQPPKISILQEWEERSREKKERAIAADRRKAALRLKAAPFSEGMQQRLHELKTAKQRMEELARNRLPSSRRITTLVQAPQSRDRSLSFTDKSEGEPEGDSSGGIVEILTGSHPSFPPTRTLPLLLIIMFLVYYADVGPIYAYVSSPSLPSGEISWVCVLLRAIQAMLTVVLLAAYALIHWSLTNTVAILSFDSIELPGQNENKSAAALARTRYLFQSVVRKASLLLSLGIATFSFCKAVGHALWSFVFQQAELVVASQQERIDAVYDLATSTGAWRTVDFVATKTMSVVVRPAIGSVKGAFFSTVPSVLRETFGYGLSALSVVVSDLAVLMVKALTISGNSSWRKEAVDTAKYYMSYTAIFLLVFLVIANAVMPKRASKGQETRGRRAAREGQESSTSSAEETQQLRGALASDGSISFDSSVKDNEDTGGRRLWYKTRFNVSSLRRLEHKPSDDVAINSGDEDSSHSDSLEHRHSTDFAENRSFGEDHGGVVAKVESRKRRKRFPRLKRLLSARRKKVAKNESP